MRLARSLKMFCCLIFFGAPSARGQDSCGSLNEVCPGLSVPPAPVAEPTTQIQTPDASALAPMPPDGALGTPSVSEKSSLTSLSGDGNVFSSPQKRKADLDPFGPESGQPLRAAEPAH